MKKIFVSALLLFAGFSHAAAIGTYGTTRAFDKFMATSTGTGAQTIKFSGSGVPLASAPTAAAVTLGSVGVVKDSASTGLIVSGTASLPLTASGLVVPVTMSGGVSAAAVATAFGSLVALSGGPVGLVATVGVITIPLIYDWLHRNNIELAAPSGFQRLSTVTGCQLKPLAHGPTWCAGVLSNPLATTRIEWTSGPPTCRYDVYCTQNGNPAFVMTSSNGDALTTTEVQLLSLEQVQTALSSSQPDPGVLKELYTIDQSGLYSDQTLKDLSITNVMAHGPSTVSGPSTVTDTAATPTTPATQTTTKTDYNCVYVMADVTCTKQDTTFVQKTGIDPATGLPYPKVTTGTTTTDTPPVDSASDTPLPDQPKLYTPKYPDGLIGVWTAKKAALMTSPLLNLVSGLMPSVPDGGSCPTWMLSLDVGIADFGVHDVAPPCWIWGFAKVVVIVSALLLARALIFGG